MHRIDILSNKMVDGSLKVGQKVDSVFNCNGQLAKKVRQFSKLSPTIDSRNLKNEPFYSKQGTVGLQLRDNLPEAGRRLGDSGDFADNANLLLHPVVQQKNVVSFDNFRKRTDAQIETIMHFSENGNLHNRPLLKSPGMIGNMGLTNEVAPHHNDFFLSKGKDKAKIVGKVDIVDHNSKARLDNNSSDFGHNTTMGNMAKLWGDGQIRIRAGVARNFDNSGNLANGIIGKWNWFYSPIIITKWNQFYSVIKSLARRSASVSGDLAENHKLPNFWQFCRKLGDNDTMLIKKGVIYD